MCVVFVFVCVCVCVWGGGGWLGLERNPETNMHPRWSMFLPQFDFPLTCMLIETVVLLFIAQLLTIPLLIGMDLVVI